ncbi:hypothetical protein [Persicobacter diffluens]|uniref:Uncharacterized protein n=1 Tax=Persicobacter diffluens TaxID=981 RepID=A0AAN4W5X0_9BACT|nr:hypothetical protein PEDI_54590 [Persicobacter diffluens]
MKTLKDYQKALKKARKKGDETEAEILQAEIELKFSSQKSSESLSGFAPINAKAPIKVETINLDGYLGPWLGPISNFETGILIRGDKGAGKTRLLFQMMNAFVNAGKSVCFFTLEMDQYHTVIKNYMNDYIQGANRPEIMVASEVGGMEGIHRAAQHFDVVAVDSWNKIPNLKQTDFNDARKKNQNTVFLAIFQSTTGRATRGGNMPEFDCDVVVHVHEGGIAKFEKNRFSPGLLDYDVFRQRMLQSGK